MERRGKGGRRCGVNLSSPELEVFHESISLAFSGALGKSLQELVGLGTSPVEFTVGLGDITYATAVLEGVCVQDDVPARVHTREVADVVD